jgi:hypothetical protein
MIIVALVELSRSISDDMEYSAHNEHFFGDTHEKYEAYDEI